MKATRMNARSLPFPVCLVRWTYLLTVLLGATFPAALFAQEEPLSPQAQVLKAQVDGMDLLITVRWPDGSGEDPVSLSLLDRDGETVASSTIWPEPGAETVSILADAFEEATSRPQHHEAQLVDGAGELVGTSYPLQFGLHCEDAETCRFKVRGGVSAPEMIVISPAMALALAEAETAGVEDVLAYVGESYPQLWGDVYSMAWQVEAMGSEPPLGGKAQSPGDGGDSGCTCLWNLQVVDDPISIQETSNLGANEEPECGASRGITYRRVGSATALTELTVTGSSRVTPTVGCWRVTTLEPVSIGAGESEHTVRMVALAPCASACSGSVVFSGTYTTALTTSTRTAGDKVSVLDGFNFWVDSMQVTWDLFSLSTQGTVDDQTGHTGGGAAIGLLGSTAEMNAGTTVVLEYDPTGVAGTSSLNLACNNSLVGGPCAEGTSDAIYNIHLQGQSNCTGSLLYEASATVAPQASADGINGDDISILVGKCDDH